MRHQVVAQLVEETYKQAKEEFAHWMWKNHLPVVAKKTEKLSHQLVAKADLAVAGAWLHDFGDAFVHRHDPKHEALSQSEAKKLLERAGYSNAEITEVIDVVIAPHSCKDGFFPQTLEGKILATADALAHLTTDFYLQFSWMHLPEGKTYSEFIDWVNEKLDRDFRNKIFFEDVKEDVKSRYLTLKSVFKK